MFKATNADLVERETDIRHTLVTILLLRLNSHEAGILLHHIVQKGCCGEVTSTAVLTWRFPPAPVPRSRRRRW